MKKVAPDDEMSQIWCYAEIPVAWRKFAFVDLHADTVAFCAKRGLTWKMEEKCEEFWAFTSAI